MTVTGKGTVLVTGASSGIGAACAGRLRQLGFRVFAGVRQESDYQAIERQGRPDLRPVYLDVTDSVSIAAALAEITAATGAGGLQGLVNNAGIATGGPLECLPLETFRQQLEINVTGQLAVTQAFLPLIRQGRGRLVFISSISGRFTAPFIGPYCASKFALEALADAFRLELLPWNIPVSLIEPGTIATPIWEKSLAAGEEVEKNLSPEAQELYGRSIQRLKKYVRAAARRGAPVSQVAEAVEKALTAPRPKLRYVVGRDAQIRLALLYLPGRARDRLVAGQVYGKKRA